MSEKSLRYIINNYPKLEKHVGCLEKMLREVSGGIQEITDLDLNNTTYLLTLSFVDSDGNPQTVSADLSALNTASEFIPNIVVDTYNDLPASAQLFEFAEVRNSQGTAWLPGSIGGTFRGSGLYYWNGTEWVHDNDKVYQALQVLIDALAVTNANLAQEIADRITGDTTLQNNINTEEAARIAADNGLQAQITANDADIVQLQNDLIQEIADRIAGDLALQGQITINANNLAQEITDRISADNNLQAQITANDADITTLQTDLIQEIADRIAGDAALQAQITTNTDDINTLDGDLTQEIVDRILGDSNLQTQINNLVLNSLSDVNVPTPTIGDLISWDGVNWVNIVQPIEEFLEATLATTQQLAPGTAYQDITGFDAPTPNTLVGGTFNTGTGVFTCTVAGVYRFDFQTTMNQYFGNNRTDAYIRLALNGALVKGTEQIGYHRNLSDGKDNYSFTKSIALVPGNTIVVQARNGDTARDHELFANSTLLRITKIKQ